MPPASSVHAIRTSTRALVLLGHGSSHQEGRAECLAFARLVETTAQGYRLIQLGLLELAEPTIPTALERCADAGVGEIHAVPIFLTRGRHATVDLPASLETFRTGHPAIRVQYGDCLGVDDRIVEVLTERMVQAWPQTQLAASEGQPAVVLVGRGAKDTEGNVGLMPIAARLAEVTHAKVRVAFTENASPTIVSQIEAAVAGGAEQVLVLPYLLFAGLVLNRLTAQVEEAQGRFPAIEIRQGGHLGPHPNLAAVLLTRAAALS